MIVRRVPILLWVLVVLVVLVLGAADTQAQNYGNIAPSTVIGNSSNTNKAPAAPMGTISLHGGVITGDTALAIGTYQGPGGYSPGFAQLQVWANGAHNGFISQARNDVAYATNPFLAVGVTGSGVVPTGTASVAFGVYGVGELNNATGEIVGAEFTARNFSASNAAPGPIPPTADPQTYAVVNGLQVTCGTVLPNQHDCSTGILVSSEAGGDPTKPSFDTAATLLGFRHYGLYIEPNQTAGIQTSAQINNRGAGTNLVLQTTGPAVPSNAVLAVYDQGGIAKAAVYQSGGALFSNPVNINGPPTAVNLNLHIVGTPGIPANAVFTVTDNANAVQAAIFENGDIHGNNLIVTGATINGTAVFNAATTIQAPNSTINLTLKTTGAAVPSNAVFTVTDNTNAVQAAVFQNGDIHANNITLASGSGLYIAGTPGVNCAGAPSSSFAASGGVITHC